MCARSDFSVEDKAMPYRIRKRGAKYHIQKRSASGWKTIGRSTSRAKAGASIGHRKRGAHE